MTRRIRCFPSQRGSGGLKSSQSPSPVSTLAAAPAVAALESPPAGTPGVKERERLSSALPALGLEPLKSHANFVFVPRENARALGEGLMRQRIVVWMYE